MEAIQWWIFIDDVVIDKVKTALKNNEPISINFLGDEGFIRESSIDENGHEIDKETKLEFPKFNPDIIADGLDKLKAFSILDKSLEELTTAKKRLILYWSFYMENNSDEDWTYNCNLYRVKIKSIIESILGKTNDDTSQKQLEYINKISESLSNKDLKLTTEYVNSMNQLENPVIDY